MTAQVREIVDQDFSLKSASKKNNNFLMFQPKRILWVLERTTSMRQCFWAPKTYVKTDGPVRVAQSVTCLATDTSLTANPGVASSIPARFHTFVEIDHEIISTVILLPSAESLKKGCCQLQAKVCAQSTG